LTKLRYIDDDIVRVYKFGKKHKKENLLATLFWGDNVRVVEKVGDCWKLDFTRRRWNPDINRYEWVKFDAEIPAEAQFRDDPILKVRFVDVGQGDAAIIESPQGKIVLLDGGEGDHLRHYVSASWAHVLRYQSLEVEAIVVTHGDADHFAGLTKLLEATRGYGQSMVNVKRIYHSGLVKASTEVKIANIFGKSKKKSDRRYVVDLVDDQRTVPDSRLNRPFKAWKKALNDLAAQNPSLEVRRLAYGDHNAFDFLAKEGIAIQVLGPIVEEVDGVPALPYLHGESGGISASHTVNGHSIVLKLVYGNVRFLLGADLNAESEAGLLERVRSDNLSLSSEVLKVPHHGSQDFTPRMLEAVRPTVSIVSSGDESESTEYIHPRAGLIGALGKYSHLTVEKPLIYVTEMVAFFERVGHASIREITDAGSESKKKIETTNAYIKTTFGIVHVRTDGERVLVATHGGKPRQKESYAFQVDKQGKITFEETRVV
jgi:beta-lactamase superfamily II metal-dependent hydrolase